ncbi:HdeD family acid-resistance protein [Candidatus Soleaferrea massiliensis]|uniref:HdeD family acid-resistance protein n=1 Tax=Candidatus Soleaferrea massiliensis TaxID=1470354 RepID=UPI00058C20BA|nr:DUF308 domain-containing protein [Candidatus Soleaferrea massiliensis]
MNKKVYFNAASLFVTGLLIIAAGILMFFVSGIFRTAFHLSISILFMVIGAFSVFTFVSGIRQSRTISVGQLLTGLGSIALGIVILCNRRYFMLLFPIVFALYALLNAVVRIVVFFMYTEEKVKGRWLVLLSAFVSLGCCVILLSNPSMNVQTVFQVSAVYMILYGTSYLEDFIRTVRGHKQKDGKRRLRFTLPVVWEAILPYKTLIRINKNFRSRREQVTISKRHERHRAPDMEIFIHVSEQNFGVVGHMDFYFDNMVISYGSYDESTQRLHAAFGDGVLFFTDKKDEYIRFCKRHSRKTIFSFGLKLTKEQKETVRGKLHEIQEDLVRWLCPIELAENAGEKPEVFTDYASELYKVTKPVFYKFERGEFKNYFVLKDNCVQLADQVIGCLGTDILGINGIICPGTYYDYLDREFLRKGSMVISKTIYH